MTGAAMTPLPLFCLLSFALGAVFCALRALMGAALAALSLWPVPPSSRQPPATPYIDGVPQAAKTAPKATSQKKRFASPHALGYFLWDLLFFVMAAIGYLVFSFATAGGELRLYSLLLVLLGFSLFYPFGRFLFRTLARILLFVRGVLWGALRRACCPIAWAFRRIFQKKKAKT